MDDDFSSIIMIFLMNYEIRNAFLSCLEQYVRYGNNGRNFRNEYQIKLKLAQFNLPNKIKQMIQKKILFLLSL